MLAKPRAPTRGRDADARARLAAAIAALREAEAIHVAAMQAVEAAEAVHVPNRTAAYYAEEALKRLNSSPSSPQMRADTEAAFATAQAAYEGSFAELRRAREAVERPAQSANFARERVRDAGLAVLRVEAAAAVSALAAQVIEAQRHLVEPLAALDWLERQGVPVLGGDRLALALRGHLGAMAPARPRGAPIWEAALDALQHDADAPLPG